MNTPPDPEGIPLPDDESVSRFMAARTRRGFLLAGAAAATGMAGFQWLRTRPQDEGALAPLRRVLGVNEKAARAYFSDQHRAREFPLAKAAEPRANGDVGLAEDLDASAWRLQLDGAQGSDDLLTLTLDDIRKLPRVEEVTEIYCIEGWSQVVHWAGARFRDFIDRYPPASASSSNGPRRHEENARYVALETPDEEYYVGLDIESALHPQTLLCYEMNGSPLTAEHGAPLRLVIPVKYGIKNLKRIGTIRYASERPPDYWAERGYDWYAGL